MRYVERIRDLRPGDRFYLLRTMQRFIYIGKLPTRHGKMGHFVCLEGETETTTLHHSCHVKRIVRPA